MAAQVYRITQNGGSSLTPSLAPVAFADNVMMPTSVPTVLPNNFTVNNPNEIPVLNFILYLFICIVVLSCLVFCNQRKAAAMAARNTGTLSNAALTNFHQQMNAVEGFSPEERKEYVTNFLKTQKFENKDGPGSFRITQSSSTRVLNDTNENCDLESNVTAPSCAICLDPFQDGEDICSAQNAQCPHEFHLTCIFPWLLKSQECPCCRRDYLSPVFETDGTPATPREEAPAPRTGT